MMGLGTHAFHGWVRVDGWLGFKDIGAKKFKKEASLASHSDLHIEASIMDQGRRV